MGADGAAADQELPKDGEFGFMTLDRTHTLKSFNACADWVKQQHFGCKLEAGKVGSSLSFHC